MDMRIKLIALIISVMCLSTVLSILVIGLKEEVKPSPLNLDIEPELTIEEIDKMPDVVKIDALIQDIELMLFLMQWKFTNNDFTMFPELCNNTLNNITILYNLSQGYSNWYFESFNPPYDYLKVFYYEDTADNLYVRHITIVKRYLMLKELGGVE